LRTFAKTSAPGTPIAVRSLVCCIPQQASPVLAEGDLPATLTSSAQVTANHSHSFFDDIAFLEEQKLVSRMLRNKILFDGRM